MDPLKLEKIEKLRKESKLRNENFLMISVNLTIEKFEDKLGKHDALATFNLLQYQKFGQALIT